MFKSFFRSTVQVFKMDKRARTLASTSTAAAAHVEAGGAKPAFKSLAHYQRVPDVYHSAWFYKKESPYETWQLALILNALEPSLDPATAKVGDVGGGTGRFAGLLSQHFKLKEKVHCVDLSEEMLKQAAALDGVSTELADCVDFASRLTPASYDRFLLKEVVHHVPEADIDRFYADLFRGLRRDGICLTVTRPSTGIEYPFFDAAKVVWAKGQPKAERFATAMRSAGFFGVTIREHVFPVTMRKDEWLTMVANRFWSTFGPENFSDAQMEEGLAEIDAKFKADERGNICFNEKMVFVEGFKV